MIKVSDIVNFLQAENSLQQLVEKAVDSPITGPANITEAQPGHVSFCGSTAKNAHALLSKTQATLIIVDNNMPFDKVKLAKTGIHAVILSENSRLDFIRMVKHFFSLPQSSGIHPSVILAPSAVLESDVSIGPFCSIGQNVRIGKGTVIYAGVHIYDGVNIGRNVIIHSGTVIGADGFGYERNKDGKLEKFPHLGGVVIEDDVEIHALVHIARGTLGNTLIGKGTKIDTFCHIAHNVKIGKNCMIISHALIGGSVTIGNNTWVAPCACLRDRICVGSDVVIGLASLVTKNVPDGQTVMGVPARPAEEQKKLLKQLSKLAEEA